MRAANETERLYTTIKQGQEVTEVTWPGQCWRARAADRRAPARVLCNERGTHRTAYSPAAARDCPRLRPAPPHYYARTRLVDTARPLPQPEQRVRIRPHHHVEVDFHFPRTRLIGETAQV